MGASRKAGDGIRTHDIQLGKLIAFSIIIETFRASCSYSINLLKENKLKARLFHWRARMLLEEATTWWLGYIHRYKPRTQVHYKMVIERFAAFAPVYAADLKAEHIDRYVNHILQKYINRTANAHLTALKSFCRWLAEHYELPNPCLNIKMLDEDPPKVRIIDDLEYQKILAVCKPKERDMIRFLAHTGLRSSEFRQLTWQNISHDRRFIKLAGKGRRQRLIPLNKTCQKILDQFPQKPGSTTIKFTKSYKSIDSVYRSCKRLAVKAGIPRFGPHALRHYFATELYRKGVPLHMISIILGHADTRTTEQIYVHIFPPRDLLGITDILD